MLTRVALLVAAALPWFAAFSGTYGLYFYILLAAVMLAPWLRVLSLVLIGPLAALLLLFLPAGGLWATLNWPPKGWFGRLTGPAAWRRLSSPLPTAG